MQVLKSLQDSVKQIEQMYADYEDLGLLIEMSQEEQDEETVQEIEEELLRFEGEFEELRIQTLLTESMTEIMRSLRFTPEQAEQNPVTGQTCFTECTPDGQRKRDFP